MMSSLPFCFPEFPACDDYPEVTMEIPDYFQPKCLQDGRFSPLQCNPGTGICYCVSPEGATVPGTAIHVTEGVPTCKKFVGKISKFINNFTKFVKIVAKYVNMSVRSSQNLSLILLHLSLILLNLSKFLLNFVQNFTKFVNNFTKFVKMLIFFYVRLHWLSLLWNLYWCMKEWHNFYSVMSLYKANSWMSFRIHQIYYQILLLPTRKYHPKLCFQMGTNMPIPYSSKSVQWR